jgi:hypothetical protein
MLMQASLETSANHSKSESQQKALNEIRSQTFAPDLGRFFYGKRLCWRSPATAASASTTTSGWATATPTAPSSAITTRRSAGN